MALKGLAQFTYYDKGFFVNLKLISIGKSVWKDYESGTPKGTKGEFVIAADKNKYKAAEGEVVNNVYEKLTVKFPKGIDIPMNVEVRLVNPEATVYGDYRNQLSIIADDIEVVSK